MAYQQAKPEQQASQVREQGRPGKASKTEARHRPAQSRPGRQAGSNEADGFR